MTHILRITIHTDGRVESTTEGVYGTDCLTDVGLLEDLLDGEAVDSRYTPDFDRISESDSDHLQVVNREPGS